MPKRISDIGRGEAPEVDLRSQILDVLNVDNTAFTEADIFERVRGVKPPDIGTAILALAADHFLVLPVLLELVEEGVVEKKKDRLTLETYYYLAR